MPCDGDARFLRLTEDRVSTSRCVRPLVHQAKRRHASGIGHSASPVADNGCRSGSEPRSGVVRRTGSRVEAQRHGASLARRYDKIDFERLMARPGAAAWARFAAGLGATDPGMTGANFVVAESVTPSSLR